MGFMEDMKQAAANIRARENKLQSRLAERVFNSIRDGDTATGAPGQPVDTGALYKSWRKRKVARREWEIVSNSPYADVIEENRRGATLRSSVGGFHSVKLTRLGWNRLVAEEVAKLGSSEGNPTLVRNPQVRDRRGRFTWTKKARVGIGAG